MDTPSIFGSTTYHTASPFPSPNPLRTRTSNARNSPSEYVLSSDIIGIVCSTCANPSLAAPPTLFVGESGEAHSGCASSSPRNSRIIASNAWSEISGAASS